MVCSADVRYCATDAWFQIKEVDLGNTANKFLFRLPRLFQGGKSNKRTKNKKEEKG